jgi:hypothetical protein
MILVDKERTYSHLSHSVEIALGARIVDELRRFVLAEWHISCSESRRLQVIYEGYVRGDPCGRGCDSPSKHLAGCRSLTLCLQADGGGLR